MSSLETFHGGQFTFSIQLTKPNNLVISPTDAATVSFETCPRSSSHWRNDSIYTPLCKLDFHSRVYQGFGACMCMCVCVCVCVWRGRGRGMLEGECAPPFVNFTSLKVTWRVWWRWERGRENFEPLFLKLTSPPGCMMGKRGGDARSVRKNW